MDYNDSYPTCELTHATVRVYSDTISPEDMASTLRVTPTSMQWKGDVRNPNGRRPVTLKLNALFVGSEGHVESLDATRHIDWVLDRFEGRAPELASLIATGARADLRCFWVSASGHGGPTLSPQQCKRIAELGVDCWFDVYVGGDDEEHPSQGTKKTSSSAVVSNNNNVNRCLDCRGRARFRSENEATTLLVLCRV
jgi:hypothetical protein